MKIGAGVSGRHVHLCRQDLEILFGPGAELTPQKYLSIPSQFVCEERVTVNGLKGSLENVAIIGPLRQETQVEVSKSDAVRLGQKVPIRLSGNLEGSESARLVGPAGEILLKEGLIVAMRHIHMTTKDADDLGFVHRDFAMVVVQGPRSMVMDYVVVRVGEENTHTELHLDTDEANAANLATGDEVELLHINDKKLRLEQLINMLDERQLNFLEGVFQKMIEEEKERLSHMENLLRLIKK